MTAATSPRHTRRQLRRNAAQVADLLAKSTTYRAPDGRLRPITDPDALAALAAACNAHGLPVEGAR